jgi:hypothetical protein
MRAVVAVFAVLVGMLSASAQEAPAPPKPKPAPAASKPAQAPATTASKPAAQPAAPAANAKPAPIAATPKPKAPAAAASQTGTVPAAAARTGRSPRDTYAAMTLPERVGILSDLIWATDYNGLATGEFTDAAIVAIKAFQKNGKTKDTGILNPQERAALAAAAKSKRDAVGWRMADDPAGGGRVGLPGKLVPQTARAGSGSRWTSAHGEIVVETFRVKEPGITLAAVFAQQRKEPVDRRVEYNVMRDDFFVISGLQGLKKFYLRAQISGNEVRGLTVLYDQAVEGTMDKVAVAMSSAFTPFSTAETAAPLAAAPLRRMVEYGSGIVVSKTGDIVTDRPMTDGCQFILVPSLGNAERVAEDPENDLALLRVYGARDLAALPLAGDAPAGPELTIVGIADPQAQGGGGAVSTAGARLGAGGTRAVEPAPGLGFSGAPAIDGNGRFLGMVQIKPQVVAGSGTNLPPAAALVPVEAIRTFAAAHAVPVLAGRSGVDDAKASVVRVICVRK